MKQPRITDFDPNAPVPPLGSPLDGLPRIQPPPPCAPQARSTPADQLLSDALLQKQVFPAPTDTPDPVRPATSPNQAAPVPPVPGAPPVPLVPPVRPVPPAGRNRRAIKQRHPFDIYEDQLESLRALALEERKQGGVGSMSAMVRAALDTFILKKKHAS